MATYNAYIGGTEITGFPLKEKDTTEIYCGNTLFWKKGESILYSVYARYKEQGIGAWKTAEDGTKIRLYEEGWRFPRTKYNKKPTLRVYLCGAMARKYTYTTGIWTELCAECSIAFKGEVINLDGELELYAEHYYKYIDEAGNTYKVDLSGVLTMIQDSDGVYSMNGTYTTYPLALTQQWNAIDIETFGTNPNMHIFSDIEELKAYLNA